MKNLLFKDIHLKIFALLLSFSIWFFTTIERNYRLTYRVPIQFNGLPPDQVISDQSAESVEVNLEGKGKDLLLLHRDRPSYIIAQREGKTGRERVRLVPEELGLKRELKILGFRPEYLEFEIEERGEKKVLLKVPQKGKVARGQFLTEIKVLDTVFLAGPKSELPFITFLLTETLCFDEIKETGEREIKVLPPAKRGFSVRPERVRVKVTVEPETTITIAGIPVQVDGKKATISPKEAEITVSGPTSLIRGIKPEAIRVQIVVSDLKPGTYHLPSNISLPPGLIFQRCVPDKFRVEIK